MIVVDNRLQVAKIKLAYMVTLPVGLLLIFSSHFISSSESEALVCIILGSLLVFTFIFLLIIKPQYLYFSAENSGKIIIRTYHAFPAFRKYKAFEMNAAGLQDYEIRTSFFGFLKSIRFSVLSNQKIGKYPWISLSAVSKKEFTALKVFLDKLLKTSKQN